MSIQAMVWVLEHSRTAGYSRLVLLAIANHADAHGHNAWPSIDQISREANVSRATTYRALNDIVTLNELEITTSHGGRGRPNHYRLPLKPSQPETLYSPERVSTGDKRVSQTQKKGLTTETRTVLNRQEPRKPSQPETLSKQPQPPTHCTTCQHPTWDCTCGQPTIQPNAIRDTLNGLSGCLRADLAPSLENGVDRRERAPDWGETPSSGAAHNVS
jgi:helix-turn-helix protein